jgi:hypothetical protein
MLSIIMLGVFRLNIFMLSVVGSTMTYHKLLGKIILAGGTKF